VTVLEAFLVDVVERATDENNCEFLKALALTGESVRSDKPTWSCDVLLEPDGCGYLRLSSP
jgi:hypothetical protein